jgi:3-mercaptopyruvate sulfurtransferase SseA
MKVSKSILLALAAVFIVIGSLWLTNRAVTPKEATWKDILEEARKGGYQIIKTQELWVRYQKDPNSILVVDTRQDWEYRAGHIRGAVNFPMEPTWWSRWQKQKSLGALVGPNKNRFLVFY